MEIGYGLLLFLISAIIMCAGVSVLCIIEKIFINTNEEVEEEEDDDYICYREI